MPITALNSETVKLLKSTQVVNNIWSVIKELVENSLDANAKSIEIYLTDDGLSSIRVCDNGTGICEKDAALMALPSHTSKMTSTKDLESLTSYGFRGIALHSICVLADVSVTTKTEEEQTARVYKLDHNGHIEKTDFTHGNTGTTVEVRNLCKNFPVRRKILSDPKTLKKDLKNVEILIKDFSICNPEVRFVFKVNNKMLFTKLAAKDLKQALTNVIGHKNVINLYMIKHTILEIEMDLMIPKKDATDLTDIFKSGQSYIFVNKRPIKHKEFEQIILKKIIEYFSSKQPNIKKALFVFNIKVNPADVDVNLEPNKDKVFLHNKEKVEDMLNEILNSYYGLEESEKKSSEQKSSENENNKIDESLSESIEQMDIDKNNVNTCLGKETVKQLHLNEKSNSFECKIKPLDLSESDSDGEKKVPNRKSKSPCMDTIIEQFPIDKTEIKNYKKVDNETLSQLPLVDLGEDFDISNVSRNLNTNNNQMNCKDKINSDIKIGSDAWSRGHIAGGGGVDVVPVNHVDLENLENQSTTTPKQKHVPESAFKIFFSEIRPKLMKENPDAKEAKLAREITKKWHELSSKEREYYRNLAQEQMDHISTPRSQKRPLDDGDLVANKKKFIKFLENMKRENNSNAPKNLVKKTIIPWNVTLQDVITNFRNGLKEKKPDKNKIFVIGQTNNTKFWFVTYNGSNWLINVPNLLKNQQIFDISVEQVNANLLKTLLQEKLSRDPNIDDNIMYQIHDL